MKVNFAYYLFRSLDGASYIAIQATWRNPQAVSLTKATYKLLGLDNPSLWRENIEHPCRPPSPLDISNPHLPNHCDNKKQSYKVPY